jgi:hypothetical protein
VDAGFVRMMMIAVLEAQETMERGVSEKDNLSTFYPSAITRMESARPTMKLNKGRFAEKAKI